MLTFAHSTYFHDLLDSFSAGVVIANVKGLVYASNPAAARLLGETREALADPATARAVLARADKPRQLARFLAAPSNTAASPTPSPSSTATPTARTGTCAFPPRCCWKTGRSSASCSKSTT